MDIKFLDLMVSLWLFSRLVRPLSKLIFWTSFSIFIFIFCNAQFGKILNSTFISLIPKKSNAMEVRDFQPICLVGEESGCKLSLLKFLLIG